MYVRVITRQSSDIFETQCISSFIADTQLIIKTDGIILKCIIFTNLTSVILTREVQVIKARFYHVALYENWVS